MQIKAAIFDMDGTLVDSLTAVETVKKLGMKIAAIYDRYNFGQDEMQQMADRYVAEGESLAKLI